jgi:hypothetical protein
VGSGDGSGDDSGAFIPCQQQFHVFLNFLS